MSWITNIFKQTTTNNVGLSVINNVQQELIEDIGNNTNIEDEVVIPNLNNVNDDYEIDDISIYSEIRYSVYNFETEEDLNIVDSYASLDLRKVTYTETLLSLTNKINLFISGGMKEINILDVGCGSGGILIELIEYINWYKIQNNILDFKINYTLLDFNSSVIEYCEKTYSNINENINVITINNSYESYINSNIESKFNFIITNRAFDYNLQVINPDFKDINITHLIPNKISTMDDYYIYIIESLFALLDDYGVLYISNQRYNETMDYIYNCNPNTTLNIFNAKLDMCSIKSNINITGIQLDSFQITKLK